MRTRPFTAEHDLLRSTLRRVIAQELTPPGAGGVTGAGGVADHRSVELLGRCGDLGLLGLDLPVSAGGQGGDRWSAIVLAEEVARTGSRSLAAVLTAHAATSLPLLWQLGHTAAHRDLLAEALTGRTIVAAAVADAVTDAVTGDSATHTPRAHRRGDGWVLDGEVHHVIAGADAGVVLVAARTAPATDGDPTAGLTLLLVDTDRPGVRIQDLPPTVGLRTAGLADLRFTDVHLDADAQLGPEAGAGVALARVLLGAQLLTAVGAVATAQLLFEQGLAYTRQREAFGRRVADFQVIRHRMADLTTAIAAARAQVYDVADRWSSDEPSSGDTVGIAMAKLTAATLATEVADAVLQLHGGYGYSEELPVAGAWRDVRALRLYDGSDEDLRERIADHLAARAALGGGAATPTQQHDPTPTGPGPSMAVYTPAHQALRVRARRFVATELTPHLDAGERTGEVPREVFRTVGAAGFLGLRFGPEVGGSGPDLRAQAVWVEELSRCLSGGLAADLGASTDLAGTYLQLAGTPEQQQRFLPGLIRGERIGALAITEPGAGSDVAAITTRARRDGDGWVLDGAKVFTTNGSWADHLVVAAKVSPADGAPGEDPHAQLTLFVVDGGTDGLTRRRLSMLGWRTSHTGELALAGVRVDDDRRLGAVGSGFAHITTAFAWERLVLALGAVATAERCLELVLEQAPALLAEGGAGSRPGTTGAWRHRWAELVTRLAAGRALTEQGLRLVIAAAEGTEVDPAEVIRTAAMAKLATQRLAVEVADAGLQSLGPAGYRMDSPLQRVWRDARLGPIGGGTDEIMRQIIARTL